MNRCSNNKNDKQVEQLKEELKSDLSFIEALSEDGFSRLKNGQIAYKSGNEIFEDSEDESWESYKEQDKSTSKLNNMKG